MASALDPRRNTCSCGLGSRKCRSLLSRFLHVGACVDCVDCADFGDCGDCGGEGSVAWLMCHALLCVQRCQCRLLEPIWPGFRVLK